MTTAARRTLHAASAQGIGPVWSYSVVDTTPDGEAGTQGLTVPDGASRWPDFTLTPEPTGVYVPIVADASTTLPGLWSENSALKGTNRYWRVVLGAENSSIGATRGSVAMIVKKGANGRFNFGVTGDITLLCLEFESADNSVRQTRYAGNTENAAWGAAANKATLLDGLNLVVGYTNGVSGESWVSINGGAKVYNDAGASANMGLLISGVNTLLTYLSAFKAFYDYEITDREIDELNDYRLSITAD